jgi:hypothetical protein
MNAITLAVESAIIFRSAIACPEINLSTKLENQLAENEYPLLMLPLFYALPLQ